LWAQVHTKEDSTEEESNTKEEGCSQSESGTSNNRLEVSAQSGAFKFTETTSGYRNSVGSIVMGLWDFKVECLECGHENPPQGKCEECGEDLIATGHVRKILMDTRNELVRRIKIIDALLGD